MVGTEGPYDLERFVEAQKPVIERVKEELRSGRKRSHWMWFVFPQVAGLGGSEMSRRYAISSRGEAQAFLNHTVLGPRLRECTEIVNNVQDRSATEIFGSPDDKKFRSSMTLFEAVAKDPTIFSTALDRYFDTRDEKTLEFLR